MELMWVMWFIFGLVSGVIVSVFSVCKGEHDGHCNSVPDNDNTDRECNGMDRPDPTPEEISNVLYLFRIGASNREKRVLDYLIDKEGEDDEAY